MTWRGARDERRGEVEVTSRRSVALEEEGKKVEDGRRQLGGSCGDILFSK
jgi:hypothetical protein